MAAVKLLLTCVLLTVGLLMLPSLIGTGVESMTARLWFVFGLLVFSGHYLAYQKEAAQQTAPKQMLLPRRQKSYTRQQVRSLR